MTIFILFIGRYLMYLLLVLLFLGLIIPRYRHLAITSFLAAGLAYAVGWTIKEFFYLPRPFITAGTPPVLPYLLDGSLPSSHTAVSFAIAAVISLRHSRLGLIFIVLALLIAAGRILGGVHTYLDVLSGTLIGLASALILVPVDSCQSQ